MSLRYARYSGLAALVCWLWLAAGAPAAADFQAGIKARQAGDYATAYREWREDAEAGNMHAQFEIAEMLRQGLGTERNLHQAFQWYLRAAQQNMVPAQRNVGVMYGRAIGVKRDDIESYKWLSLAAAQGDHAAAKTIDFLAKRMTREYGEAEAKKMIGEAKFRAASWQPKVEAAASQ